MITRTTSGGLDPSGLQKEESCLGHVKKLD